MSLELDKPIMLSHFSEDWFVGSSTKFFSLKLSEKTKI